MTKSIPKVLVTGAAGFIGGSICIFLKKRGYHITSVDCAKDPSKAVLDSSDEFINDDFVNVLTPNGDKYDFIVHCAGTSLVGPSINNPGDYYPNNLAKTILLLEWMRRYQPQAQLLFSSSASVYDTKQRPLVEDDSINPLSPYANSKRMIEVVIDDYAKSYGLKATVFRYFNACGSFGATHGQLPGATHIFPKLFESAIDNGSFILNGNDYPTPDGTCIRDYIHVMDLAIAHNNAMEYNATGIFNLGNGIGISNEQIINSVAKHYPSLKVEVSKRRQGDAASLVADISKAKRLLRWSPVNSDINTIIADLHLWYTSDNFKRLKCNQ